MTRSTLQDSTPQGSGMGARLHGLVKAASKARPQHRSLLSPTGMDARTPRRVGLGLPQQQRKDLLRLRAEGSGIAPQVRGNTIAFGLAHSAAGLVHPWAAMRHRRMLVPIRRREWSSPRLGLPDLPSRARLR